MKIGRCGRWRVLLLGLFIGSALVAQTQPVVSSVSNPTSLDHLSPGVRASVYGTGFSGGTVTVQVAGKPAPVFERRDWIDDNDHVAGQVLSIQVPVDLAPGPTSLLVISNGLQSQPFGLMLGQYSPAFEPRTFETASPSAGFVPYTCDDAPKAGDIVRAYAIGLGATEPAVPTGSPAPLAPLARMVTKPDVTVGGQAAEVVEAVLSPGEIGVYRISFRVPVGDGMQAVALGIGGQAVTGSSLAVGNALAANRAAAPESILTAFACGGTLTKAVPPGTSLIVVSGDAHSPPLVLAGTTVKVKDSAGAERLAGILYLAPNQVNYVLPSGLANGKAVVTVTTPDNVVSTGALEIRTVAPSLFMDSIVGSTPSALVVRVRDGVQTVEPIARTTATGLRERVPIDLGPTTDQVFLVFFGTGLRFRSSPANIKVSFNGVEGQVEYAGPQNEFAGLDQVNVRLPRSLAGRGQVPIDFFVDGISAYDPSWHANILGLATVVFK